MLRSEIAHKKMSAIEAISRSVVAFSNDGAGAEQRMSTASATRRDFFFIATGALASVGAIPLI
jgi:hypothetical protein